MDSKDALEKNDLSVTVLDVEDGIDKSAERKLVWQLDARFAVFFFIYILNYIDRQAIPNARLNGFQKDLELNTAQYSTVISIFYIFYILGQLPSNLIIAKMRYPGVYLGAVVAVWGLISALTGLVTTYTHAIAVRLVLGLTESAFFPGAVYMLSKWYTRRELALRVSIMYCGAIGANGWGSLIAAGVLRGFSSWRPLFYIEGGITIGVGFITMVVLPGFPETAKWMSPKQKQLQLERMKDSAGPEVIGDVSAKQGAIDALSDWKTWVMMLSLFGQFLSHSFTTYFPTIVKTLGYNTMTTYYLSLPPWMFSCLVCLLVAWSSDRYQERVWHITIPVFAGVVGSAMAMSTTKVAVRYTALFVMASSFAGTVLIFPWFSNIAGESSPAKRAAALAIINSVAQLGAFTGGYCWPSEWGPRYQRSFGICLGAFALTCATCWGLTLYLKGENKRLAREYREENGLDEDHPVAPRYVI